MRLSNPLHLRNLLEDKRFAKCRIVLLHASYPFSKEASFLSSVYPQVYFIPFQLSVKLCQVVILFLYQSFCSLKVYLDFGLAVPKLSVHGMVSSVKELLDLAPIKKVITACSMLTLLSFIISYLHYLCCCS